MCSTALDGGTLCVRRLLMGVLCMLDGPNHFTYLHILGTSKLHGHCRCATYILFFCHDLFAESIKGHT